MVTIKAFIIYVAWNIGFSSNIPTWWAGKYSFWHLGIIKYVYRHKDQYILAWFIGLFFDEADYHLNHKDNQYYECNLDQKDNDIELLENPL
jgi:hypothetical protein